MNTDLNFQLAEKIQKYITENIGDSMFTDKNVYSAFAYSPRHLNRVYKQFTGKTICEYIKVMRLITGPSVRKTVVNGMDT